MKIPPLRGDLPHARWSGEAAWVPLGNLDAGVGLENATRHLGRRMLWDGAQTGLFEIEADGR